MANLSIGEVANAIHALINRSPRTPLPDQIGVIIEQWRSTPTRIPKARELDAKLRAAMEREERLTLEYGKTDDQRLVPQIEEASDELQRLSAELPMPPRSLADLRLYAELAHHGADKDCAGRMTALEGGDCFERPAARLIQAVLTMGGLAMPTETPLLAKVRTVLSSAAAAHQVEAALPNNDEGNRDDHPARLEFNRMIDAVIALEKELPTPATQPDQQLALALLANFHMLYFPEIDQGQTEDHWNENAEQRCAMRLLRGFLLAHGERPAGAPYLAQ
jgi:hypothetical protein